MSYQHERDTFIQLATKEGLDLATIHKLLRHASTLHRLAEAQCNGDYPYNGDRDRPSRLFKPCEECKGTGYLQHGSATDLPMSTEQCLTCQGTGQLATNERERIRHDDRYTVCPKCETSGVRKSALKTSTEVKPWHDTKTSNGAAYGAKVCPDCRTQELVRALLAPRNKALCTVYHPMGHGPAEDCQRCITPIFQGDPRGAVLVLSTPNHPWTEDGRGRGLYVPARGTR